MSQNPYNQTNIDEEREYVKSILDLQKSGKIDRHEVLKRFSEWKRTNGN